MAKVQNFSGISPDLLFTEFDFYELYRRTFETSELGKIRKRLPLREMAENFGLTSKSLRAKKGRKTYFTLLRERDALSYGCEASVGRHREVI